MSAKRFTSVAAFGAALALALSYFATLGYLSAFGWHAIWLAAFADYLPTALAIFPLAFGIAAFALGFALLMPSSPSTVHQLPRYEKVLRIAAFEFLMAAGTLYFAADGTFTLLWPFALSLLVLPLISIITLYVSEKTERLIILTTVSAGMIVLSFGLGNFISVLNQRHCRTNSAQMFLIGSESVAGCLVWSGDRGMLVVSATDQKVTFYRWDQMHQITFER
jgi:hypothetical protein